MDEMRIRTLEDIRQFLAVVGDTGLVLQGTKDEGYRWMQRTLIRFHYMQLGKIRRGLLLRYIERLSGYSRQHVSRLVGQFRKTGDIRRRQHTAKGFGAKYTRADIALLADVDRVVDDASGTMVKTLCERMFDDYGDGQFERLASISVSHLYNLRKGKVYQRCRRKFTKTKAVRVNIGERCKPQADGEPGHLRVDSVHLRRYGR